MSSEARSGRVTVLSLQVPMTAIVDNTQLFVSSSGGADVTFINTAFGFLFEPGEFIIIEKIWYTIDYEFEAYKNKIVFDLLYDNGSGNAVVPEMTTLGEIPRCGISPNILIAPPDMVNQFAFKADLSAATPPDVSMINVPDILNGQEIEIDINLQVYHTRAMIP